MQNEDCNDIQACLDGDNEAYRRLVQRYQAPIAALMWRFSTDRNVCEMLVQDVFVEAYFSLKTYKGKGPFLHWLKKIAARTGYRFWKQQEKQRIFVPLQDFDALEIKQDEPIEPQKASEILRGLLGQLPRQHKLVLTLMYFDGCSTEEIARRMGWTRAAVKMRALRARKKMKKIAEKQKIWEKLGWIQ